MQSGIFDRTRLFANILMVILVGMNIFFSIQYTEGIRNENNREQEEAIRTEERLKYSRFMKLFIDSVLGTNGTITYEDRVRIESDILSLNDPDILNQWNELTRNSKDAETAQKNAVKLMSMLAIKMI